jgi:hypothetical protein
VPQPFSCEDKDYAKREQKLVEECQSVESQQRTAEMRKHLPDSDARHSAEF